MRTSTIFAALVAVSAVGCDLSAKPSAPVSISTEAPAPTHGASPSVVSPTEAAPSAPPVASLPPVAAPLAPPDLPRIATKQANGVRFRIELQRNPLPAGEASWVKIAVTNRGSSNVTWYHDGCASLAGVGGRTGTWAMGRDQVANEAKFKASALGGSIADEPDAFGWIAFVPEAYLGKGGYGCADLGMSDTIRPGETLRQTRWWSGYESENRSLPPAGALQLLVFAGYYFRGDPPENIRKTAIELSFPGWIEPKDQISRLSPAQVVDAALDDRVFSEFLRTQDIGTGREAIAWYSPGHDLWEVGLLIWQDFETPRILGVQIEPRTGAVLGSLDRPWDQEADGFP